MRWSYAPLLALSLVGLAAACSDIAQEPHGIVSDAVLVASLKEAERPVPVRQALGEPDAEFVCQQFDLSDWPEDSVEYIREGLGGTVPDTKFKGPVDEPFLYVAGKGREKLILLDPSSIYPRGPTTCVRADTGVFARIEGQWMLRDGEGEIGSPEGWALVRKLRAAEGPVTVAKATGIDDARYVCLTGKIPSDVVDWMHFVEEVEFPDTRIDPPRPKALELGLYIVGGDEEAFILVPVGEGLRTTAGQHCVQGEGARFEPQGSEWVLTGRKVVGPKTI